MRVGSQTGGGVAPGASAGESVGPPELWESDLIPQMGGLFEGAIVALGERLQLRDVANQSLAWDVDIPLRL